MIRTYAERLVGDGVDVVLDEWGLSEGQDKYAFMEKMVTDRSVTHVLIFSDEQYARKADARKAGVGTESQIISKEVYDKVEQSKFLPLVCQWRDDGEPFLPAFLKSRIWIDFSTPEKVNENWEQLLRALHGKPLHEKPRLGKPPAYLTEDKARPALPTIGKFTSVREALLHSKRTAPHCRNDFLDAAIDYAEDLRIREGLDLDALEDRVLSDLRALLPLRDQLVDWLLLETSLTEYAKLEDILVGFLERILALKYRPPELKSWNEAWFDSHRIFVYELFMYVIASLVKADQPSLIHELMTTHYLLPESEASRGGHFVKFKEFWTGSEILDRRNKRLEMRRLDPLADLIKERATRSDISFREVMQAELLTFLCAAVSENGWWYPHSLIYCGHGARFPLFVRAAQHKHFARLKTITGVASADDLRGRFNAGHERLNVNRWTDLVFHSSVSFSDVMNMDALDTID